MMRLRKYPLRPVISKLHYGTSVSGKRPLQSNDIRRDFLDYFVTENGHKYVKSSPVVPFCDPTVPFVNAGMVQFKNILLDKVTPLWKRVANSQKCIRVNDLSLVGTDGYHHTLFEMLGNWSFNDYGKEEACRLSWNLLTGPYNIHPSRLYVTYFAGNSENGLEPDLECLEIWRKLGVPKDRILPFGMQDNFWAMGMTGPSGPCTEIHIDHLPSSNPTTRAQLVNAGLPDLTELWNIVFIEYNRNTDGTLTPLPRKHIDTGMGLERLVAILQGQSCNYSTDLFIPIFEKIAKATNAPKYRGSYDPDSDSYQLDRDYRILADHARMITICIGDGIYPNFNARLRHVLRKSILLCEQTFKHPNLLEIAIVPAIVESLGTTYSELERNYDKILQVISYEDEMYKELLKATRKSLSKMRLEKIAIEDVVDYPGFIAGCKSLDKMLSKTSNTARAFTGEMMYELYKSNGLDEEILIKIAESKKLQPDLVGFHNRTKQEKEKKKLLLASRNKGHAFQYFETLPVTENHLKYEYQFNESTKAYEISTVKAKILAVEEDVAGNGVYHIIADRSNFYSTAGGQACDVGEISNNDAVFRVTDVSATNTGVIIHTGNFINGQLNVGDSVELIVDQNKRTAATLHHTATHLLHAALKRVTNCITYQISSDVSAERLSLDVGIIGPKPSDEDIAAVEQCIRDAINQAKTIETLSMTPYDLYACDSVTLIPGIVYNEQAISVLKIESDDLLSMEPCCGTHARNTSELQDFHITVFRARRGRGLFKFEAVSGNAAKKATLTGREILEEIGAIKQIWKTVEVKSAINLESKVRNLRLDFEKNIITMPFLQRTAALNAVKILEKQLEVRIKAALKKDMN